MRVFVFSIILVVSLIVSGCTTVKSKTVKLLEQNHEITNGLGRLFIVRPRWSTRTIGEQFYRVRLCDDLDSILTQESFTFLDLPPGNYELISNSLTTGYEYKAQFSISAGKKTFLKFSEPEMSKKTYWAIALAGSFAATNPLSAGFTAATIGDELERHSVYKIEVVSNSEVYGLLKNYHYHPVKYSRKDHREALERRSESLYGGPNNQ